MSIVGLVSCPDTRYEPSQIEAGVRQAVELAGGIGRYVQPGQRVLLKPNLLRRSAAEDAIITHPRVVRAMVRLVQEAGGRPLLAESPGGPLSVPLLRATYAACGLQAIADETGAELNFDTEVIRVPLPDGRLIKAIELMHVIQDVDVIISLSKLKTHGFMGFTGATKNLFGLVPGVSKAYFHAKLRDADQFAEMLLDILAYVKPALHLMDAVVGMDGDGPSAGRPFPIGAILCSENAAHLDWVATQIVGLNLQQALPLRAAVRRGWLDERGRDVQVVGMPIEQARVQGFKPARTGMADFNFVPRFVRRMIVSSLVASPKPTQRCVLCGVCVKNCPMHAISLDATTIRINLNDCIRCYCCHELCPSNAIDLTQPLIQRLVR